MIPKLDLLTPRGNLCLWQTTDGVVGTSFDLSTIDVEARDESAELTKWSRAVASLPTGLVARIETTCEIGRLSESASSRAEALGTIGFREYRTRLHIQTNRNPFLEMIYRNRHGSEGAPLRVEQGYKQLKEAGLDLDPLGDFATSEIFERSSSSWVLNRRYLAKGESCTGMVRLFRPTAQELTTEQAAQALAKLPGPFTWTTCVQKCAREAAELGLQKRLRQETGKGKVLSLRRDAIESTLADTSLSGSEVFEYEVLISIERSSEAELGEALLEAAGVLRAFGDVVIETVGVGPSFLATLPGVGLHVPLLEVDSTLPLFLPVWRQGAEAFIDRIGALTVHRRDRSLDGVDLLLRDNQNANAVIIGNSGRGKSAFLGCLTNDLMNDPSVRIIKVDVGGSHSKECELLGGREYRISLETSEGLNPFSLVHGEASESVRAVLGSFVESLVLEEGETRLPKEVKIEIDHMIQAALASGEALSIDRLLKFEFSRNRLLRRWGSSGLFGKAFRGSPDLNPPRLRYFNFQDIFQASDQDFSQAAMAAVLAVFNLEMRTYPSARLVLICDETPFFIEKCFGLFKISTANVRKFGGSVILVAQLSKHLVVGGDTGILENSHHRILFSADGDLTEFRERLRLREKDMSFISSLGFKNRKYSEFLYQEGDRARVMRLELSPEEYWRVTSSQSDRSKLLSLVKAVPGLTTEEAIRCLSVASR